MLCHYVLIGLDLVVTFSFCFLPGYSPAWEVCSLLGQCDGYGDLEARQELLAFSLTHCPPDSIHGLLAASSDLQTQVNQPGGLLTALLYSFHVWLLLSFCLPFHVCPK